MRGIGYRRPSIPPQRRTPMKLATRMWLLGAWCPRSACCSASRCRSLVSLSPGSGGRSGALRKPQWKASACLMVLAGARPAPATSPLIDSVRLFCPTGDLFWPRWPNRHRPYPPRRRQRTTARSSCCRCARTAASSTPTSVPMAFAVAELTVTVLAPPRDFIRCGWRHRLNSSTDRRQRFIARR